MNNIGGEGVVHEESSGLHEVVGKIPGSPNQARREDSTVESARGLYPKGKESTDKATTRTLLPTRILLVPTPKPRLSWISEADLRQVPTPRPAPRTPQPPELPKNSRWVQGPGQQRRTA